jgi:hypothetical protein
MFPDACGAYLVEQVRLGADPRAAVPDDYFVVRGGIKPMPAAGIMFSATVGPTLEAAASAVPHSKVRVTTAGEIPRRGGVVEWIEEFPLHGTLNEQHVHVTEAGGSCFSAPQPSPVPKKLRIDKGT